METGLIERGRGRAVRLSVAVVVIALSRVICADAQNTASPGVRPDTRNVTALTTSAPVWRFTASSGIGRVSQFQVGSRISVPPNVPEFGTLAASRRPGANRQQPPQQVRRVRSTRSKVLGGIVGGVGGVFGGMFLGAAIEGDRCNCDDPG
jgi:hypothetical protein